MECFRGISWQWKWMYKSDVFKKKKKAAGNDQLCSHEIVMIVCNCSYEWLFD